jgi:hypothetical protein
MTGIGTFINLGVLWFLNTLFTGSIDAERSYRETWIVWFGVALAGLVGRGILGDSLGPHAFIIQTVALYFLVGWCCDTERRVTLKITGWYFVLSAALSLVFYLLSRAEG